MGPYQSTPARAFLMGREDSINPAPAAAMLLRIGVKRPSMYSSGRARRFFRPHARTHNPLPAAIAIAGAKKLASALGIKTGSPRYENGPLVTTVQDFLDRIKKGDLAALEQLHGLATSPAEKHRTAWAKVWNVEVPALGGSLPAKVRAAINQLDPTSQVPSSSSEKATSPVTTLTNVLSSKAGLSAVTALARGATRAARRPRRRVVGYDVFGQKIYAAARAPRAPRSPRISAASAAGVAGGAAPLAAGAGTIGGASAAAVAGVVIGGLAVGLLIGTGLRKVFGEAKAVRAEEAAVQGALVLRSTRAQLEGQLGRKLKPNETRALFSEYTTQLQRLGFTQDDNGQWIRKRSLAERFFG